MRGDQFRSLLDALPGLTGRQLEEMRQAVAAQHQRTQALRALEAAGEGLGCPHCNSLKFTENGHSRGPAAIPVRGLLEDLQRGHQHAAVAAVG